MRRIYYSDGPFDARIVDADTKQPIEDAAVAVVWWADRPRMGDRPHFFDVQEAVTDKAGRFHMPGISGFKASPWMWVEEPLFLIFKPEYAAVTGQKMYATNVDPDGDGVIEMKRLLTSHERLENYRRFHIDREIPWDRVSNLIRVLNEQGAAFHLGPMYTGGRKGWEEHEAWEKTVGRRVTPNQR
jgi:hypothetical protein